MYYEINVSKEMAENEFITATEKFASIPLSYNGVAGRLWTKWTKVESGWLHFGKRHVHNGASEMEIMVAFDVE